jgi:hypothetical protein
MDGPAIFPSCKSYLKILDFPVDPEFDFSVFSPPLFTLNSSPLQTHFNLLLYGCRNSTTAWDPWDLWDTWGPDSLSKEVPNEFEMVGFRLSPTICSLAVQSGFGPE